MLRSVISLKHDVDISKYLKLKTFLKRKSTGFKSKKAKVLNSEQIQLFIDKANDEKFLFTKVALIFGICGACRSHELKDLEIQDVQDLGSALFVTIPKTKTNLPRSFTIVNTHYKICKRYINLRPQGIDNTRDPRYTLEKSCDTDIFCLYLYYMTVSYEIAIVIAVFI
ncbi:hypothetical protein Zmor_006629 [Zophobas morio]|uniref:Uncharacterized protein n=1 Tax=Zophobas morio TaxID=2755281 RepID=A0AA38MNB4_9CUCU|nr:hypothetical protein Zmor_006629 [Zophobas morio]